jgi:hypothetical protein
MSPWRPALYSPILTTSQVAVDAESPLNPAELQVLRAQYEKEGELVGVQTKFNYAWVSQKPRLRRTSIPLVASPPPQPTTLPVPCDEKKP